MQMLVIAMKWTKNYLDGPTFFMLSLLRTIASTANGVSPRVVYFGRSPHLPLDIFGSIYDGGHQDLERDQL